MIMENEEWKEVGSDCIYETSTFQTDAKIIGLCNGMAWIRYMGQYKSVDASKLYPINSKQEIEREEITEEILDLFDALDCPSVRHVEAICTAGYRNNGEEVGDNALIYDHIAKIDVGINNVSVASANIIGRHLLDNFKIYPRNP